MTFAYKTTAGPEGLLHSFTGNEIITSIDLLYSMSGAGDVRNKPSLRYEFPLKVPIAIK